MSNIKETVNDLVEQTIKDLIKAGTKPELPHVFLHHVLFHDDSLIERFISAADKLNFECDEPEYIDGDLIDEQDQVFANGYWNLDLVTECTLTDKEQIITDILDVISLVEKFPKDQVQYGLFGAFIETGDDEDIEDAIYWDPSQTNGE